MMISIERQARIANGLWLLLACGVAWVWYPIGLWAVVVMGASLIFSGWANYCGHARLLPLMPWNRKASQDRKFLSE